MAKNESMIPVTPAQAQWIVERLIADRRVSAVEVRSLLSDLHVEVADIERRLADLRAVAGEVRAPSSAAARNKASSGSGKTVDRRKKKGHVRGIAGTLIVLLRSIPVAEHAAIEAIKAKKGIKAAIKAAQQVLARKSD